MFEADRTPIEASRLYKPYSPARNAFSALCYKRRPIRDITAHCTTSIAIRQAMQAGRGVSRRREQGPYQRRIQEKGAGAVFRVVDSRLTTAVHSRDDRPGRYLCIAEKDRIKTSFGGTRVICSISAIHRKMQSVMRTQCNDCHTR